MTHLIKKTKNIFWAIITGFLLLPLNSEAQIGGGSFPGGSGGITNPLKSNTIQAVIGDFIDGALTFLTVVAVFCIIYSGFLFLMAQGDPKKIETARATFLWTVVGTAVVLGARVISAIIQGTIGSVAGVTF